MNKILQAVLLALAVSSAYSAEAIDPRFNVVKIDPQNHRLFVAPSNDFFASHDTIRLYIKDLSSEVTRVYPSWGTKWVVSFFTDPELATYKDDDLVRDAVRDGTWVRAYFAEYDHETLTMTQPGMSPDQVKWKVVE